MKFAETIIKVAAAIAAVAGIAYLIVKYMDAIKAWAEKLCPCCVLEEDEVPVEEEAVEETVAEEAPVEEAAAEEAPAAADDSVPVADDADFEA